MIASSPATRRKRRAEGKVIDTIRDQVQARDGFCRLACKGVGPCQGLSEWAHLGAAKRFKTRGLAPELRHTTAGTAMICTRHHRLEEAHRIHVEPLTANGLDGPCQIRLDGVVCFEERQA